MGNGQNVGKCSIPICRPFTLDFLLVFLFFFFCFFFAPHLSPKLSQFLYHTFSCFILCEQLLTQKKNLSFEFVQEDHTRTSKGREGLSKREAKNIAGVEDVFFSSVRGRVFFRAKRRRRRRRRSRAFIRSGDFFFLKGAFKKGCCVK